jgi:hypothetical protein
MNGIASGISRKSAFGPKRKGDPGDCPMRLNALSFCSHPFSRYGSTVSRRSIAFRASREALPTAIAVGWRG